MRVLWMWSEGPRSCPKLATNVGATPEPPEVFAAALDLERQVSQEIIDLYYEAHQARDFATVSFLEYFLDEQVKSERELTQIVADLDRADCPAALLLIDRELGARQ